MFDYVKVPPGLVFCSEGHDLCAIPQGLQTKQLSQSLSTWEILPSGYIELTQDPLRRLQASHIVDPSYATIRICEWCDMCPVLIGWYDRSVYRFLVDITIRFHHGRVAEIKPVRLLTLREDFANHMNNQEEQPYTWVEDPAKAAKPAAIYTAVPAHIRDAFCAAVSCAENQHSAEVETFARDLLGTHEYTTLNNYIRILNCLDAPSLVGVRTWLYKATQEHDLLVPAREYLL